MFQNAAGKFGVGVGGGGWGGILTKFKFGIDRPKLINNFQYCVQEGDRTNITYKF